MWERGRRLDETRSAYQQKKVAALCGFRCSVQPGCIQLFPKPNDIRPYHPPAIRTLRRRLRLGRRSRGRTPATVTVKPKNVAMQFDDRLAAGRRMQAVYILRYQCELRHFLFQGCQCQVPGIGSCRCNQLAPPVIPAPDEVRIAFESLGCCQVFRIVACPQARLSLAERRDTAFSRDSCTGQSGYFLGLPERMDQLFWDLKREAACSVGQGIIGRRQTSA